MFPLPSTLPTSIADSVPAPVTTAKGNVPARKLPQAIAHRGLNATHPENTMGAFKGAVDIGAHAIETDLHISKDGVVVLSHVNNLFLHCLLMRSPSQDPTLKRCFGASDKIIDCDWSYLRTLRTIREPHEAMSRLKDLLDFLTTPGLEEIWVLLDIKRDNDSDAMMKLIAETLAEVKPTKPWEERIVLGCWAVSFASWEDFFQSSRLTILSGKIYPTMLEISARLPNSTHWLQHIIRTSIPESPQIEFQHESQGHRRTWWR